MDHVTNEEIRRKIQAVIGKNDDLILGKKRKLRWFCHVSRFSGLADNPTWYSERTKKKRQIEEDLGWLVGWLFWV